MISPLNQRMMGNDDRRKAERGRGIRDLANDRVPTRTIRNGQMKAEKRSRSALTEASLVMILRLARAKKHL